MRTVHRCVIGLIEGYDPAQFAPGQTTTLNFAIHIGRGGAPIPIQSLEFVPPDGISVGPIESVGPRGEGIIWWKAPVTVTRGAAPGPRTLVAVRQNGRTQPVTIHVPDHVLTIANLAVTSAPAGGETIEFRFSAAEGAGAPGDVTRAWYAMMCSGAGPVVGVARGKAVNGVVTAAIPNPKTLRGFAAPTAGQTCTLEVRATDQAGVESNTLSATFTFK